MVIDPAIEKDHLLMHRQENKRIQEFAKLRRNEKRNGLHPGFSPESAPDEVQDVLTRMSSMMISRSLSPFATSGTKGHRSGICRVPLAVCVARPPVRSQVPTAALVLTNLMLNS